jgi:TonB family protein
LANSAEAVTLTDAAVAIPEVEVPVETKVAVENPTVVLPMTVPGRMSRIGDVGDAGVDRGVLGGETGGTEGGTPGGRGIDGVGSGFGPGPGGPGSCVAGPCGGGPGGGGPGGGGGPVGLGLAPPPRRVEAPRPAAAALPSQLAVAIPLQPMPVAPASAIAPPPRTPKIVRVSALSRASLIHGPAPAYPDLARKARIEGTVKLAARIDKQGAVVGSSLTVVSGNPLLTAAGVEAVRQWRYKPMILNGEAVEVETFIDIVFVLR